MDKKILDKQIRLTQIGLNFIFEVNEEKKVDFISLTNMEMEVDDTPIPKKKTNFIIHQDYYSDLLKSKSKKENRANDHLVKNNNVNSSSNTSANRLNNTKLNLFRDKKDINAIVSKYLNSNWIRPKIRIESTDLENHSQGPLIIKNKTSNFTN